VQEPDAALHLKCTLDSEKGKQDTGISGSEEGIILAPFGECQGGVSETLRLFSCQGSSDTPNYRAYGLQNRRMMSLIKSGFRANEANNPKKRSLPRWQGMSQEAKRGTNVRGLLCDDRLPLKHEKKRGCGKKENKTFGP